MEDAELERLKEESMKPFRCPHDHCDEYLTRPICHNHSHARCELYSLNSKAEDFLQAVRGFDGDYSPIQVYEHRQ